MKVTVYKIFKKENYAMNLYVKKKHHQNVDSQDVSVLVIAKNV
jgi:hypothetical protein